MTPPANTTANASPVADSLKTLSLHDRHFIALPVVVDTQDVLDAIERVRKQLIIRIEGAGESIIARLDALDELINTRFDGLEGRINATIDGGNNLTVGRPENSIDACFDTLEGANNLLTLVLRVKNVGTNANTGLDHLPR
jgi:hypothetical protein